MSFVMKVQNCYQDFGSSTNFQWNFINGFNLLFSSFFNLLVSVITLKWRKCYFYDTCTPLLSYKLLKWEFSSTLLMWSLWARYKLDFWQ